MKPQINIAFIQDENNIKTDDTQYIVGHNGHMYIGKFIDASTGTFYKAKHFIWNGSVFPQGIPFKSLSLVTEVGDIPFIRLL